MPADGLRPSAGGDARANRSALRTRRMAGSDRRGDGGPVAWPTRQGRGQDAATSEGGGGLQRIWKFWMLTGAPAGRRAHRTVADDTAGNIQSAMTDPVATTADHRGEQRAIRGGFRPS
jgi:hypothetical protein